MELSSLEAKFARFAATRDARALADVFDATAAELARVARHLTRDEAEAEDVVQGTFLEAMEHAARFDATRPLLPWLVGILEHQAHDARRRSQRCLDATRVTRERPRDAAHEASSREFFAQLAHAVRELPETYRVVLASHIDGRTSPEIGKDLGLEDGTVRVRIHRGLALLRKLLPPGFLAGALFVELTPRGLAAVRDALTASAGAGTLAAAGGWIVVNKLIVGAAAAVLVGAVWFLECDHSVSEHPLAGSSQTEWLDAQTRAPMTHESVASVDAMPIEPPSSVAQRTPEAAPDQEPAPWSRGLVRNAIDLTPIANAAVHGRMWDPEARRYKYDFDAVSRADGSFDIPATFSDDKRMLGFVVASADGFGRARNSRTGVDPREVDPMEFVADIRMQPVVMLEGRVAREDGAAVADATIEVFDALGPWIGRLTTTTDASGDYRIGGFEPSFHQGLAVKATDARGRALAAAIAERPVNARSRCDLVVRPARSIDVVVRAESDGRAIAEANVVVLGTLGTLVIGDRIADYPGGCRGRTDNDGRLHCNDLLDLALDVFAVAQGYEAEHRHLEAAALDTGDVVLSLTRGAIAAGIVLSADGSPLPGEALRIETEATPSPGMFLDAALLPVWRLDDDAWQRNPFRLTTTTGDDGRFRFESVPARKTARIMVGTAKAGIKQDEFGPFALEPGDMKTDLVVRVAPRVRVEVQVFDDLGRPLTEMVAVGTNRLETVTEKADDRGYFVLEFPAGTPPPIAVLARGFCPQLIAPEHLTGGPVAVRLVRGKSLAGVIVDETGAPANGVQLLAVAAASASSDEKRLSNWYTNGITAWPATIAADGSFTIEGTNDVLLDLSVGGAGVVNYIVRDVRPGARDLHLVVVRRSPP